jgi:hypothetical protein
MISFSQLSRFRVARIGVHAEEGYTRQYEIDLAAYGGSEQVIIFSLSKKYFHLLHAYIRQA